MDWLRVVPGDVGIPGDQLEKALLDGWVCCPKVSVGMGGGGSIIVPGREGGPGVVVVDIWYRPLGMVPSGRVIAALQAIEEKDPEWVVIDFLARQLLGMGAQEVLHYGEKGEGADG